MSVEPLKGHPDRSPRYSSPSIHERRKRLLHETRKLIGERGVTGFSVRELCRRAGVAQRTLYNAFHDKDRLIGIAIREAYDEVRDKVHYQTADFTLAGMLDRAITLNRSNLTARNYAQAIATIYFSPSTSDDLWQVLQDMAVRGARTWLQKLRDQGQLHDWVIIDDLSNHMATMEYGVIHNWCAGRLSDDDYLRNLLECILIAAVAATKGAAHEEASTYLRTMRATGTPPTFPKPVFRARSGQQALGQPI